MNLEAYQCGLAALVLGADGEGDDAELPYLRDLAGTARLALVREVVCFWRAHQLAGFCVLSAALLKRWGRFEDAIARFIATVEFSPLLEEAGLQFLQFLTSDADPIVAALAQSEMALHATHTHPELELVVVWPCHPAPVLAAILNPDSAPLPEFPSVSCRMRIARFLPAGYVVEGVEQN